jgi:hypothetical protein
VQLEGLGKLKTITAIKCAPIMWQNLLCAALLKEFKSVDISSQN